MIFLVRDLGLSPVAVGSVVATASVGAMLGAVVAPRLATAVGSARLVWLSLAVTTPFTLLVVMAQPSWWIVPVVVSMAAGEFGQLVYAVANVSLRQRLCPDRLLGRVNATTRFVIMALFPLGAVLGGFLGELLGARSTLLIAGLVAFVAPCLLWPALRGAREAADLPRWHSGEVGANTVER